MGRFFFVYNQKRNVPIYVFISFNDYLIIALLLLGRKMKTVFTNWPLVSMY